MADGALDKLGRRRHPPTLLDRPVHKTVLLLSADDSSTFPAENQTQETKGFPNKEPTSDGTCVSDK